MAPRAEPQRTCVTCRGKAAARDLIRVARRPDGSIVVDPDKREPGRGAHVHRDPVCIEAALARGHLARALDGSLSEEEAARLRDRST